MMEKLIRNFNDETEFNYSIHISEEFRFIYFNNPKCACTTVKATLNQSCAKVLSKSLHYDGMQDIHNRQKNVLLSPAQIGYKNFEDKLSDCNYFKFCFIREPIRRVASAFQDKLTWNSQFRVALNRSLVRPEQAEISFEQFASGVASDTKIRDMDEHWRLQCKQVCFDFVKFDKVGLFENLEADLVAILRQIFSAEADSEIFDARTHFRENVSKGDRVRSSMPADVRALIEYVYRDDVELHATLEKTCSGASDSSVTTNQGSRSSPSPL